MITVRRASDRRHDRRRKRDVWLTFYPGDRDDPLADGFGTLETLTEDRLPPRATVPRLPYCDAEIVTYVREGSLTYEDSMGRAGVIRAGEFQRITPGRGVRHRETNGSPSDWAHVFRICVRPSEAGLETDHEQKRFSTAERRGLLRVIASPDARSGSLRIHQDVTMFSALLHPGQHVVHELSPRRSAWLHLVHGEVSFGEEVLRTGDGAGVSQELAVSLTAREETEILLVDLGAQLPGSTRNGDVHDEQPAILRPRFRALSTPRNRRHDGARARATFEAGGGRRPLEPAGRPARVLRRPRPAARSRA